MQRFEAYLEALQTSYRPSQVLRGGSLVVS